MTELTRAAAVIFDFNGTLCDDEGLLLDILTDLFATHLGWKLTLAEYADRYLGRSDEEIIDRAIREHAPPGTDADELADRLLVLRGERYRALTSSTSPISHGTLALVRTLRTRGTALAIVTGAQRADVDHILAHAKLSDAFATIVTQEDVQAGKPDPEGFIRAAGDLHVAPRDVVVLEDSVAGVQGAVAAGMACIAVAGSTERDVLASQGVTVVDELSETLVGPATDDGVPGQRPSTIRRT